MSGPVLTEERRMLIGALLPTAAMLADGIHPEPMYDMGQGGGRMINLRNDVMRLEFEFRRSSLGLGMGMPMSGEQRKAWERDMIEMYDPVAYAFMLTAEAMGRGGFCLK